MRLVRNLGAREPRAPLAQYEFVDIPAGPYVIRLVTYGDLEPTTPPWVAVNVAASATTYEVSFGLRQHQPTVYLPLIMTR